MSPPYITIREFWIAALLTLLVLPSEWVAAQVTVAAPMAPLTVAVPTSAQPGMATASTPPTLSVTQAPLIATPITPYAAFMNSVFIGDLTSIDPSTPIVESSTTPTRRLPSTKPSTMGFLIPAVSATPLLNNYNSAVGGTIQPFTFTINVADKTGTVVYTIVYTGSSVVGLVQQPNGLVHVQLQYRSTMWQRLQ